MSIQRRSSLFATLPQHTHIKSFVLRQGKITSSQKYALKHYASGYLLNSSSEIRQWCDSHNNLVLEIGCGMGENLIHLARTYPSQQFLGIEVHSAGIGKMLGHIHQYNLSNVHLIAQDAIEILKHSIADNTLAHTFILFADPWPKKRHHKRRLIDSKFLELIANKLQPSASLTIATDWQDYALQIEQALVKTTILSKITSKDAPLTRTTTQFERKGIAKGHEIYEFIYRKADVLT
jgi:tRNA (guanine-N7-)-methyltransferase